MVDLPRKVYLHMNIGAPVQKLIFQDGGGGHLGFGPLEKNAGIFERGLGAKFFIKGPRKSNQLSKHLSQRMVTGLRF